jgi:hypothetical protein
MGQTNATIEALGAAQRIDTNMNASIGLPSG